MIGFPNSPKLLKGGLVTVDLDSSAILNIIALQYNPETLSRTLQPHALGTEEKDRSEALRLIGAAVETIKLDAEIDATDQLEDPQHNANTIQFGIHPQLSVLETLIYPSTADLLSNSALEDNGSLEIIPMEQPLTLFVWSSSRIVPVRITDFSITEEAFDPDLNPIRAKVSLGMRVLSVDDLGFDHPGGVFFMSYLRNKEVLAAKLRPAALSTLGLGGLQ